MASISILMSIISRDSMVVRAGGFFGKIAGIGLVEGSEFTRVLKNDEGLHHIGKFRTRQCQRGLYILHHLFRLGFDPSDDHRSLAANGYLA